MSISCLTTISSCGSYQVSRLCTPQIFQGEDGTIDLTLKDKAGQPIDLNNVTSIDIIIYGLDKTYYIEYEWPHITPYEHITILQTTLNNVIINKGKIRFIVPDTFTTHLVSGDLYSSIRIKNINMSLPNGEETITFGCLKIADIKYTQLNFRNRFMEDYGI